MGQFEIIRSNCNIDCFAFRQNQAKTIFWFPCSPSNSIFYPAVSGSFVLTEAFPAIKLDGKINLIKFRASVGEVGKGAPIYRTDTYFAQAGAADGFGPQIVFPFNGNAGFSLSDTAGNAALTPEFTKEVAFGTEMAFFNNRLNIDATYYERNTRNVILSVPVSAGAGVTNVLQNAKGHHYVAYSKSYNQPFILPMSMLGLPLWWPLLLQSLVGVTTPNVTLIFDVEMV